MRALSVLYAGSVPPSISTRRGFAPAPYSISSPSPCAEGSISIVNILYLR